jgi:hypothetical protein
VSFATSTHPPAHARERPAQRPEAGASAASADPLGEVRRDLAAVLALLDATRVQGMGRRRDNQFAHALEAARREVRRALDATGAGAGPG